MASGTKKPQQKKATTRSSGDNDKIIRAIFDNILDGIISIDRNGTMQNANPAVERIFGYKSGELAGNNVSMLMPEPYHSGHDNYLKSYLGTGEAKVIGIGREVRGKRKDGSTFPMDLAVSETKIGKDRIFVGIIRDISEKKEAESKITEQTRLLVDLSTPVLKVWDHVVLLPLIGSIDSDRAVQIIENLLDAIVKTNARVAVIDVTGVSMIDTYVAQNLIKTVSAAEMLGATVLITGITPDVAQTLVKLGIDFSTIRACGPLRAGIAEAMRLTDSSFGRTSVSPASQRKAPQ